MRYTLLSFFTLMLAVTVLSAQDTLVNKPGSEYVFTKVVNHEALPVQNQSVSGTCWSFSALSFIESELIRTGKGEHNLSEMFVVRNAYVDKAENYVRMHGKNNFSAGGAFHDIPHVIEKYGIVPEEVYEGLAYGSEKHNHMEMDALLKGMADAIIENKGKKLTPAWKRAIGNAIDAYLGEVPEEFEYQGKTYTAQTFAEELELNMDDYVYLTSYTHHPFYDQFVLEVPDNWNYGLVHNVPLEDMMEAIDHALENGYTLAWAADVSEKGFSFRDGLAIVPEDEATIKSKGTDSRYFNDAGAEKISNAFLMPIEEKEITQEMRQEAFDNYQTTDDHGMHMTGIYEDQNGNRYYMIKNSWGDNNACDGYFLASEAYVAYKTMDIMLHKDALPKDLKKKLNL